MYLKFKVGPCISGSGLKKLVLPQMYAYSANFRSTGHVQTDCYAHRCQRCQGSTKLNHSSKLAHLRDVQPIQSQTTNMFRSISCRFLWVFTNLDFALQRTFFGDDI